MKKLMVFRLLASMSFRFMELLILAAVVILGWPQFASSATFIVNSVGDVVDANPGDGMCETRTGTCTLRAAIMEANHLGGSNTIVLPGNPLPYSLIIRGDVENDASSGDLDIVHDLTILGGGSDKTIINGNRIDRIFHIVTNGVNPRVHISGVTVQHGEAEFGGGIAIDKGTSLRITDSVIRGNTSQRGGGIYNAGSLEIVNSKIQGNNATGSGRNEGGGIYNEGVLDVVASIITLNGADDGGGGVLNKPCTPVPFSPCPVLTGDLFVMTTTIDGNHSLSFRESEGAGIRNDGGRVILLRSTVSNNSALGGGVASGGGISTRNGRLIITSSTISGNKISAGPGGGIGGTGGVDLRNVTITNNEVLPPFRGGGISIIGTVTLNNSIIAGNYNSDESPRRLTPDDCSRSLRSGGFNILGTDANCEFSQTSGDQVAIDHRHPLFLEQYQQFLGRLFESQREETGQIVPVLARNGGLTASWWRKALRSTAAIQYRQAPANWRVTRWISGGFPGLFVHAVTSVPLSLVSVLSIPSSPCRTKSLGISHPYLAVQKVLFF